MKSFLRNIVPVGGHAWGNNLDWFFIEESLGADSYEGSYLHWERL